MTPNYLFRVWSKQSHGTNTPTLFAPASRSVDLDNVFRPPEITAQLVQSAFVGRPLPECPFIFFTDSSIYALQLAAKKKADGYGEMQITCVDTSTSCTPEGASVEFRLAKSVLDDYGAVMRTKHDGSARDYPDEYITIHQSVILGPGSTTVAYDRLIQLGLFQLYPHLEAVNQRRRVMWYHSINDLREYGFAVGRPIKELSKEKIIIAAQLAASFTPAIGNKYLSSAPIHLVAAFLALQKRNVAELAVSVYFEWDRTIPRTANVARQHSKHNSKLSLPTPADSEINSNEPLKSGKKRAASVIDLTEDEPSPAKRSKRISTPVVDLTLDEEPDYEGSRVADARQYQDLLNALAGKRFRLQYLGASVQINQSVLLPERGEWEAWHRQSREAYRAQKVYTERMPRRYSVKRGNRRGAERSLGWTSRSRWRRFDLGL
ncbi:hypothetical protein NU195Hw_g2305t1 [Hortaea werneckii]